jgi:pyruvate dehydrogenase E2 component (dihydrolipoamide acetyltransferase)
MATPVQLPALSPTMKEGKILKWLKKEGDKVSSGEAIAECETDKSNLEIEAYDDGYLLQILVQEGETAAVGSPIAMIGAKGEKVSAVPSAAPAKVPAAAPEPAHAQVPAPAQATERPQVAATVVPLRRVVEPAEDSRLRASPLAKKMAREEGVDLASLHGSGPQGRIVKRDIEAAMGAAAPKGKGARPPVLQGRQEPTVVPISSMRKVISQRMAEVKPGVPHFYLSVDVEMDEAMRLREQAKAEETKISVNDLIVKAAAVALRRKPKMNVSLQGDHILQFANADVGIAVAIEDGLITPVIRDADQKPLGVLGEEARGLAERARKRALKPEEYSGGSVTVSNLGMFGIDSFIAVINPPQAAIIAVGSVSERPVVRSGQLTVRKMMTVTLSGDHRVIDGATGAEYLQELKALLEKPVRLLF